MYTIRHGLRVRLACRTSAGNWRALAGRGRSVAQADACQCWGCPSAIATTRVLTMGGLRVTVVRPTSWVRYQLAIVKRPRGWRPWRWDASPPKAKILGVLPVSGTARDVERLVRKFNRSCAFDMGRIDGRAAKDRGPAATDLSRSCSLSLSPVAREAGKGAVEQALRHLKVAGTTRLACYCSFYPLTLKRVEPRRRETRACQEGMQKPGPRCRNLAHPSIPAANSGV